MTALFIAALGAPAAAAICVRGRRSFRSTAVTRITGVALAAAVVLLAWLATGGAGTAAEIRLGEGGAVLAGVRADRLSVILLVLILGVSWVVQRFAERSLAGDAQARRFAVLAGGLTSCAAVSAAATTPLTLALAWTATSVLLCAVVGLYRGSDAADEGQRRTARALLIGDGALWLAVAALTAQWGLFSFSELPELLPSLSPGAAVAIGLLVLVAAAARSVQVPFHGWLPATLASPTPVSALLHAGVVNAGAILLLRFAPLLLAAPLVMYAAVALGALTGAVGTAMTLTRPDVKGALAQSTVAQMGFMILTCGLGLWAAAVLHLAAHGFYKASRFLGSGGAVGEIAAARAGGPAHHAGLPATLAAFALAGVPMLAVGAALHVEERAALLLGFAWIALALAGRGWLAAQTGPRAYAGFAAVSALLGPAYVLVVEGFAEWIAPAVPVAAAGAPSPWLLLPAAALLALGPVIWASRADALRDRLYVWALTVGDGSRPPRGRRGNPAPTLVVESEGNLR